MVNTDRSGNFEFIPVLQGGNHILTEEAKLLWRKNNILPESQIEERARELVMVARHESGVLAGLATAHKIQVKLFNDNYFYEFRCFVDPSFRQPALDTQLVVKTKALLQPSASNESDPAIGLIMVVENETLKRWTKAVWAGADFYFAGFTSQGHHLRVSYFDNVFI